MTGRKSLGPLSYLPESKRELLGALKLRTEGATCEALAVATGVSLSSARVQLMALSSEGLVERTPSRGRPGRPEYIYRLTEQSNSLFANQNDALAIELLTAVAAMAPEALRKALDARADRRIQERQGELTGEELPARAERLAAWFEEDGFVVVASSPTPAELRIAIRHCPVRALAEAEPYVCAAEERYLSSLLPGAGVRTTASLTRESIECCYQVRCVPS